MSEDVTEQLDLSGKTALITGASGWLGSAFADALAEAGANVVAASRDFDTARASADGLSTKRGNQHFAVSMDQLDESSIAEGFACAVSTAGKIDIVVNNGHAGDANDLTSASAEDFNRVQQNATGYFLLARHLRDHLVDRKTTGNVVMIGSMYGQVASYPDAYDGLVPASPVSYHALKGGIIHMTRHLAVYWAKDGVRVNCLSPGPFPNPRVNQDMVERLKKKSPMGRMGRPEELKGALVFLASEASSYMTGQNITIDGGWTAW
ncbi:MAG: short-chain dehydrogenase [Verrucomicrobiales bacterium]|nr:short-chain dehydrogenase [Verrucomicrobiales bacterium]|tara:strand:- start:5910 stop:6701 length:792 start_codon:yes stop_codon:yes gene_type:complete